MTDQNDPLNRPDLQERINWRWTLGIAHSSPRGKVQIDELDRDARRGAGTYKGRAGLAIYWGSLVRHAAVIIGAVFVASAMVYLVARLVVSAF
jgi:hypothetical protein